MPRPPPLTPHAARMRALGRAGLRPRIGFRWPSCPPHGLRRVLPLPRWKAAIAVAAALLVVMCVPLLAVGLPSLGTRPQGLAGLSFWLFESFWLLGWATATALPGLALAALLFVREVVVAGHGVLHLRVELLGLGLGADYPAAEVHDLRTAQGETSRGTAWRGGHLAFDFRDQQIDFGSRLDAASAAQLCMDVGRVLAQPLPADEPPLAAAPAPSTQPHPPAYAPAPVTTAAARLALFGLLAANLLPLLGVLLLGWKVGEIMLVYWAESVIIGLINIAKLVVIGRWSALFYAPFFVGHYGAFMAMHLMFIMMFFVRGPAFEGDIPLHEVAAMLAALWPALLGLSVSHLLSFAQNFIGRGEYTRITRAAQMNAPYRRVLVMQFTIILGGMLTLALGSPLAALVLMIVLKMAVDVRAHRAERQRAGERIQAPP